MTITVSFPDSFLDVGKQLEEVKSSIIYRDIPGYLKAEQAKGFPTDKDSYTVFLKQRGREQKRQLSTISPRFVKIPFSVTFVSAGNLEDVLLAVRDAYLDVLRRAPVRSGRYRASITSSGGSRVYSRPPNSTAGMDNDTIFRIAAAADYSSIIEWGFYRGYYKTSSKPKGILYWVTLRIRKKYGKRISIRFKYIGGGTEGTIPVIEIGRAGLFAEFDTKPGTYSRRKKRRRRR